jgi:hypothetical protein
MKLGKRTPSGREKDEASIQLLEKLREQLYISNLTIIRQTAFNLSWLQEDGLDILKEALLLNTPRKTKGAASYGLRKMRGRMRQPAKEILMEGAESQDPGTAEICRNALRVMEQKKSSGRYKRQRRPSSNTRFEIRDLPPKGQKTFNKSRRFHGNSSRSR